MPPVRRLLLSYALLEGFDESPAPALRTPSGGPARTCQYIGKAVGPPRDWRVCGKPSQASRSYCDEHAALCYQKSGDGAAAGSGKKKRVDREIGAV